MTQTTAETKDLKAVNPIGVFDSHLQGNTMKIAFISRPFYKSKEDKYSKFTKIREAYVNKNGEEKMGSAFFQKKFLTSKDNTVLKITDWDILYTTKDCYLRDEKLAPLNDAKVVIPQDATVTYLSTQANVEKSTTYKPENGPEKITNFVGIPVEYKGQKGYVLAGSLLVESRVKIDFEASKSYRKYFKIEGIVEKECQAYKSDFKSNFVSFEVSSIWMGQICEAMFAESEKSPKAEGSNYRPYDWEELLVDKLIGKFISISANENGYSAYSKGNEFDTGAEKRSIEKAKVIYERTTVVKEAKKVTPVDSSEDDSTEDIPF